MLLRPERVSESSAAGGGGSVGSAGPRTVPDDGDTPVVTITVGVLDEEDREQGGNGGNGAALMDVELMRDVISNRANMIIQDHLEAQPGGFAKLPPPRDDGFVHQEIPKLSSKFLRPVKARAGGGGAAEGQGVSMFSKSMKIAKQAVEEDQQLGVPAPVIRPSTSDRQIAAATPHSQYGGSIDNDRLKLLEETVRSRIMGASSLAALHTSHTAVASATSAASLSFDSSSNEIFDAADVDAADKMILKLHLSKSSNSRAKALRDLSGHFFPKALEVINAAVLLRSRPRQCNCRANAAILRCDCSAIAALSYFAALLRNLNAFAGYVCNPSSAAQVEHGQEHCEQQNIQVAMGKLQRWDICRR